MPTENELKYVLDNSCEKAIAAIANKKYKISQGYLFHAKGVTCRVRKSVLKGKNRKKRYYFTFKMNVNGRQIELEHRIGKRDFKDLWAVAVNKLQKIRYEVRTQVETWECDFFKAFGDRTYISVAEVELPEGAKAPSSIPPFIRRNLILEVPQEDSRFSSKVLSDVDYATGILKGLKG
jgi:CYTH domain-containing protein